MKTYLVTGAAGFIGSNLVKRLLDDGHFVVAIDNESAECHDKFFWDVRASNHRVDINNYEAINTLCLNYHVDTIFHMAAESRIQPSFDKPQITVQTNVIGTLNILKAAQENKVRRVVYSSTSSAYGHVNKPPLVETMPNDCLTPYSISKVAGEDFCRLFHKQFGVETIILRYFNVYGENQPLRGRYAPVIGKFQQQVLKDLPITIIGSGLQRRDFTYVQDVVGANILAANTANTAALGQVFNIGTGRNYSMLELADLIGGQWYDRTFLPERPGEVMETLADNTKAKSVLGWAPTTTLEMWLNWN